MTDPSPTKTWEAFNRSLDANLTLNRAILTKMNLERTRSRLRGVLYVRAAEAVTFLILTAALWIYVARHLAVSAPVVSALALIVVATVGLVGSVGQIALIARLDYGEPVTVLQRRIGRIRTHALQVARLLVLSVPLYTAYVFLGGDLLFGIDLWVHGDSTWLVGNAVLSVILIVPVVWLFRALDPYGSPDDRITLFLDPIGLGRIEKARAILREVDEFETD